MPLFQHRQLPGDPTVAPPGVLGGGALTIAVSPGAASSSIGVDNTHTSSISGLSPGTLTLTSSPTPSSSSPSPSSTDAAVPENGGGRSTALSTGAVVGLAVGIIVALAVILVAFMTVRHRRRLRARSNSGSRKPSRKSWTRLDEPTPLQMRATNTATIADGNARGGDDSFLSLNSARGLLVQPPPPSQNPFLPLPPPQQSFQAPQLPPVTRITEDRTIPNPFSSPTTSPSHSPSGSHASTYSSAHALAPTALLSVPHAQTTSVVTSFSEYSYADPDPKPTSHFSVDPEPAASFARLARKPSSKDQDSNANGNDLRAMQDLISALDRRGPSFLTINTVASSRLSMGEGVVTPGGHSVSSPKEADVATDSMYWTEGEDQLPPR